MPLRAMEPEAVEAGLKALNPDLKLLLQSNDVSELLQATLGAAGFKSVASFQRIGTTEVGVEKTCKILGLEEDTLAVAYSQPGRGQGRSQLHTTKPLRKN